MLITIFTGHCPYCKTEINIMEPETESGLIEPGNRITVCLNCLGMLEYNFELNKIISLSQLKFNNLPKELIEDIGELRERIFKARNNNEMWL